MSKVVQLPAIGTQGRFSNWLVHYLVGKCYAEKIGATVEIPRGWVGETIFEISDPYIEQPTRLLTNLDEGFEGTVALPPFFNMPHRFVDPCLTRPTVKRIFKWRDGWVRVKYKSQCAIHLRRGDFLSNPAFPVVSKDHMLMMASAYILGEKVLVTEDEPSDTGIFPRGLSYLEDFQTLMLAGCVFVYPRSTFSQMAALLGDGAIFMPKKYHAGETICRFRWANPNKPVIFPTKNNRLP